VLRDFLEDGAIVAKMESSRIRALQVFVEGFLEDGAIWDRINHGEYLSSRRFGICDQNCSLYSNIKNSSKGPGALTVHLRLQTSREQP
jgi:hypothetical protein